MNTKKNKARPDSSYGSVQLYSLLRPFNSSLMYKIAKICPFCLFTCSKFPDEPTCRTTQMCSLKYWNIPIPTAWSNYIWQNWVVNNVYACLLIHLDFSDKLWWPIVVYVYRTIWRAGDKLLTIQAKIAFNGEPRDTMAFIPSILVQPERWTWREDGNIICIWLGNKTWLEWMAPNTWTCIGFHINLRRGKTSIT